MLTFEEWKTYKMKDKAKHYSMSENKFGKKTYGKMSGKMMITYEQTYEWYKNWHTENYTKLGQVLA